MARIEIDGDRLYLRFSHWERLGGLRKGAQVPLGDVLSAEVSKTPWREVRGTRVGTGFPGVVLLGTMLRKGKNDVVAVYGRKPIVLVTMRPGAVYQRWLATVDEPERAVQQIRDALGAPS